MSVSKKQKQEQQDNIERTLLKYLDIICKTVGLHISEWDLDRNLFIAIRQSNQLTNAIAWCKKYNSLIDLAKATNTTLNSKFYWFENLNKYINNKSE